jgi:hypothetical protein
MTPADEPASSGGVTTTNTAAPAAVSPAAASPSTAAPAASVPAAVSPGPQPAPSSAVVDGAGAKPAVAVEVKPAEVKPAEVKPAEVKPAEPAKPLDHTTEPSLLETIKPAEAKAGEAGAKADAKPGEKPSDKPGDKPDAGTKPDGAVAPEAAAPPVFQPYTLPEGITLDNERVGAFNNLLIEQTTPQERGQKLIEMHVAEMQRFAKHVSDEQQTVFANTRADWRKQAMADEEYGGSGWQTSLRTIADMRDQFVAEQHREAFNNFLRVTGAGDHPEFLRFLYNVGRKFQEPAPLNISFQPPPDIGRAPRGGKRGTLYDHPTSHRNRQ